MYIPEELKHKIFIRWDTNNPLKAGDIIRGKVNPRLWYVRLVSIEGDDRIKGEFWCDDEEHYEQGHDSISSFSDIHVCVKEVIISMEF